MFEKLIRSLVLASFLMASLAGGAQLLQPDSGQPEAFSGADITKW